MKTATFLLAAASAVNIVYAVKFISAPEGWADSLNFTTRNEDFSKYVQREARAVTLAPKRQELKPRNPKIPGAKTLKIRYGPYTVPAPKVAGGEGMINNRPSSSVDKPCQDCMVGSRRMQWLNDRY